MRIKEVERIRIILMVLVFGLLSTQVYSQQTEDQDQEQDEQSFFNDMNEERFGSNYEESASRSIDYGQTGEGRRRRDLNILSGENDFSRYQYQGEEANRGGQGNGNTNSGRVIIGSQGGEWNQAPSVGNQTPNVNMPTVKNPYIENPGVKAPRNMDAVPDNGDDPSDVPLDGGIVMLVITALALGYQRK